jgi:hypothetical protein
MTILRYFTHGLFGLGIVRICKMTFILVLDLFFLTIILCFYSNLYGTIVKSNHSIIIILFFIFHFHKRDLSIWPRFCNVENSVTVHVYSWDFFPPKSSCILLKFSDKVVGI